MGLNIKMEQKTEIRKFIKERFEKGVCYNCRYYADTEYGSACCYGDCLNPKCVLMEKK